MISETVKVGLTYDMSNAPSWYKPFEKRVRDWLAENEQTEPRLINEWEKVYSAYARHLNLNFSVDYKPMPAPRRLEEHTHEKVFRWHSPADKEAFVRLFSN